MQLLFLAAGLLVLTCLPAYLQAHAFPLRFEPKVGATITSQPERVRIWFDGALEPAFSKIAIQDKSGNTVDNKDGRVNAADATLLEVTTPPLSAGTYKVIWNVVARDGHRTIGDYSFTVK